MGINVLSLFDGIACGRVALERAEIEVDNYYASEIDKNAIKISNKNYPDIIQIGDVTLIDEEKLNSLPKIDLLIGGSPCTSFSMAGKRTGFDGESGLYWEYSRILKWLQQYNNPNILFLLENVKMKKEWEDIITNDLGVNSILIDSTLLSAQQRKRLYWTNIPNVTQPQDKKIYLKDIIEFGYYDGKPCEDRILMKKVEEKVRIRKFPVDVEKLKTLLREHKKSSNLSIKEISDKLDINKTKVEHWFRTDTCFAIPDENIWLDLKQLLHISTDEFDKPIMTFEIRDGVYDMSKRVYQINGKAPTLTAITGGQQKKIIDDKYQIRELTGLEAERLQTLDDGYTEGFKLNQRHRAIGNGWTVDVIAHILSFMKL